MQCHPVPHEDGLEAVDDPSSCHVLSHCNSPHKVRISQDWWPALEAQLPIRHKHLEEKIQSITTLVYVHLQLSWGCLVKAGMTIIVEGDHTVVEYIGHTPPSPLRPKMAIEPLVVHIDEGLANWPEPGLGQPV